MCEHFSGGLRGVINFITVNALKCVKMMLISRHLNCEVVDDDAIIIIVARALKSDFLTKNLATLSACIHILFDASFL